MHNAPRQPTESSARELADGGVVYGRAPEWSSRIFEPAEPGTGARWSSTAIRPIGRKVCPIPALFKGCVVAGLALTTRVVWSAA